MSNYVTTSRPYNYIVTSRPYNDVTTSRPYNYAVSGIGSIVKSISGLVGKSGYPDMGGFTILATKTVRRDLPPFERLRGKSAWNKFTDGIMEELKGNKRFPNEETIPYRRNSFGVGMYRKSESKTEITRVPINDSVKNSMHINAIKDK